MSRLARSWFARETTRTDHVALYVSGSAVACARAKSSAADEALEVSLRADPIKQLADVPDVLAEQISSLEVAGAGACNLVLAPELYNLALVERPDVADEEVLDAVRWTIQDQVDYPVESATLDVFPLPNSASRERPMVYVVSIETEFLKTLAAKVSSSGIIVGSIDVAELALRNLVWRCFPGADQSIAMLRLTANSGMISVSRGDELYLSRRISGVPKVFAEDSWEEFRERMVLQVQRSIDYYESAMNQPHCNVLMAACTHGWSARVCDYLSEMLAIPIREVVDLMKDEVRLTLHNPEQQEIDWHDLTEHQSNAIAAGLPAIGGVLRDNIAKAAAEAA
ncbi:MAG: hypothetical protein AAF541_00785 [Pseudomonadota bacterium]